MSEVARGVERRADERPSPTGIRVFGVAGALGLLVAGSILAAQALPFQDFMAHCAATEVARGSTSLGAAPEREDAVAPRVLPASGGAAVYERSPGLAHSAGYYALAALFPDSEAGNRLLLALAIGLFPLGVVAYARALGARGWVALGVAAGGALSMPVAMGFVPYLLATTLAFLAAAVFLRWRSGPLAPVVAVLVSLALHGVHAFGALWWLALLGATVRDWRSALTLAAGALPSLLLGGGLSGFELGQPLERVAELPSLLGLVTTDGLDDALAIGVLGALLLSVRLRFDALGVVGVAAVLACLLGPDTVDSPRIVRFATRFWTPALVLLALSERARASRWLEGGAVLLGGALAAVSVAAVVVGGEAQAVRLDAIVTARQALPPEPGGTGESASARRFGLLTLSRPEPGTLTTAYAGLHAPRVLEARGLGVVVGPFLHRHSPVRLRPDLEEVVALAGRDTLAYVRGLAPEVAAFVGDFGDEAPILAQLEALGFRDCGAFPSTEPRWRLWARSCAR